MLDLFEQMHKKYKDIYFPFKEHIMNDRMLFSDDTTPIAELIENSRQQGLHLTRNEVIIADDKIIGDNRVYSPQLINKDAWVPPKKDPNAPELGLLESNALDLAIGEETRANLLKRIEEEQREEAERQAKEGNHLPVTDNPQGQYMTVRLEEDGYTIVEINLHQYALDCGYTPDNMIIELPRSVDGIPVTRLSGGALRAILTNGIDVRLIITSTNLKEIRPNAFASLSVRNIYVSESVEVIGPQEFSVTKATVVPDSIDYHVSHDNKHFCSEGGCLYSKDKKRLLFQKWPYERELYLPEGLERIEASTFIAGAPGPAVIFCPDTLFRVSSKPSPDLLWNPASLWVCPTDSKLAKQLNSLRPNTIAPGFVEENDFYYDITEDGTATLARSPRKCDRVILPETVDGHPVTVLREQSLPRRLKALIVPGSVKEIGKNNMATGLTELYLPEGIEKIGESTFRSRALDGVVSIPKSLTDIGRGCFENALVRFEACGTTVQISPRLEASCFVGKAPVNPETGTYTGGEYDGIPFDFAAYDAYLLSNNHVPDRMQAVLLRLAKPYKLEEKAREALLEWLHERQDESIAAIARMGDVPMLKALCEMGFINEETIDLQAEECRRTHRTDAVLYLMEYKNEHFAKEQVSAHDRFAL